MKFRIASMRPVHSENAFLVEISLIGGAHVASTGVNPLNAQVQVTVPAHPDESVATIGQRAVTALKDWLRTGGEPTL